MNDEQSLQGRMNGDRLPRRVPGHQLHRFGTLPEPVSTSRTEPTGLRRGDAVAFIEESRRLRTEGVTS